MMFVCDLCFLYVFYFFPFFFFKLLYCYQNLHHIQRDQELTYFSFLFSVRLLCNRIRVFSLSFFLMYFLLFFHFLMK